MIHVGKFMTSCGGDFTAVCNNIAFCVSPLELFIVLFICLSVCYHIFMRFI